MVREAKEINKKYVAEGKAEFIHGDILDLPFTENKFDRIFTVNTLYFWDDVHRGLNELYRVLKPGGSILISIRSRETMEKMPFTQFGFRLFSEPEVISVFEKSQFGSCTVLHFSEQSHLPDMTEFTLQSYCILAEKS
jgi:ubiquinone/menaquinone biosynthesis C-methylase UbiE